MKTSLEYTFQRALFSIYYKLIALE